MVDFRGEGAGETVTLALELATKFLRGEVGFEVLAELLLMILLLLLLILLVLLVLLV